MINPQPASGSRTPYGRVVTPATPPPQRPINSPKPPRRKRSWKKGLLFFFAALFVGGSTYAYASYRSFRNNVIVEGSSKHAAILDYDPNDKNAKFNPSDFSKIGDGRFTAILLGVDKAAGLTDSIQVVSLDTINKTSTITSIPRDLYVDMPKHGRTKINAVYKFGESDGKGGGAAAIKDVVGQILATPITNFAVIDFSGLESLVDALGGIDINVPKAINDPFFPEPNGEGFSPFSVKAGQQHMNGKTALRYARSRKTTSDFDRSERQQLVMEALRKKALSVGVITNPVKLNGILKSIESNFKTDVQIDEAKTLFNIYNGINDSSKKNFVLDTSDALGLLTSSSDTAAGYINFPVAGIGKYQDIQRWYRKNNPDPLLNREAPTVTVAGTGKATEKQLTEIVDTLKDYGYKAILSSTKATSKSATSATSTLLYQTKSGENKQISRNYLASQFETQPQSGTPLNSGSDFELMYVPTTTTNSAIKSKTSTSSPSPSPQSSASPLLHNSSNSTP